MQPTASHRQYLGEYGAHAHAYAQVLVGLKGRLELELGGRSAWIDAASALIIPAGIAHGYLAARPADVLVIDTPAGEGFDRIRRFMPPPQWRSQGQMFDAVAALHDVTSASTLLQRRPIDLDAIDAAIDQDLHGRWTTSRLAALCQLSSQRFHPRFVDLTGMTPGAYVRRRRLDQAQRLLRSGYSLDAAALQVGYANASALAYALRRDRGLGARTIRRMR